MNKFLDNRMTIYEYGNPTADVVLIQLVGDHDLHDIENEITEIRNLINKDFRFIVVKVNNWYQELTPWKASAVFGNESFGDGAWQTLEKLLKICTDKNKTYYIGGYSLSGLLHYGHRVKRIYFMVLQQHPLRFGSLDLLNI